MIATDAQRFWNAHIPFYLRPSVLNGEMVYSTILQILLLVSGSMELLGTAWSRILALATMLSMHSRSIASQYLPPLHALCCSPLLTRLVRRWYYCLYLLTETDNQDSKVFESRCKTPGEIVLTVHQTMIVRDTPFYNRGVVKGNESLNEDEKKLVAHRVRSVW